MLSLFQDRCGRKSRLCALVFGVAALAATPHLLRAQMVVEAIEVPRIVVYGAESHFDLADLGPDFSEAWLADVLPAPMAARQGPALMQRMTMRAAANDGWVRQTRTTYARKENGQPRERRVERWDSTAWTSTSRTTYVYHDRTLDRQHTETWADGDWHPDHQLLFEHDAERRIHEVVHRSWRGDRWMKTNRLTIGPVDTSRQHMPGELAEQHASTERASQYRLVRETWTDDGAWKPLTRVTFTVAEDGRHVVQRNETWTGTTWEDGVRLTFLYDGAGYPLEKTTAVWTGTDWAEGPLYLYDYEIDEHRIVQHTETWVGSDRIRTEQTEFTYATPLRAWLLSEAPQPD